MVTPLRLAFDQNFPLSLIEQVAEFLPESMELSALQRINARLTTLDDRPLVIALRQLGWHGLITNNDKMLYQPHEVAAIVATKMVVVAVDGLGHDPMRAAGALLLELPGLETPPSRKGERVPAALPAQEGGPALALPDAGRRARRGQSPDQLWRAHRPDQREMTAPLV